MNRIQPAPTPQGAAFQLARESEERYRLLFESATDAIFVVGPDGLVVSVNPAAERLSGYTSEELIGTHAVELIAPEWRDAAAARRDSKLSGKTETDNYESVMIDRTGRRVPVEVSSTAIRSGGGVIGIHVALRDISERKRAESALRESEERFRQAFEAAPIGMALVAPDGHWLQVNRTLCKLVGYTEEELLGKTFQDITHPADVDENVESLRRLLAGEIDTYEMEKRYIRKDGGFVWILLSVSLVRGADGSPAYEISQILDITDRKLAERRTAAVRDHHPIERPLSEREREVLALLAEGMTNVQVASRLGIGSETVQTHVRRAMKKLKAATRTEAVAAAIQLNLLEPAP